MPSPSRVPSEVGYSPGRMKTDGRSEVRNQNTAKRSLLAQVDHVAITIPKHTYLVQGIRFPALHPVSKLPLYQAKVSDTLYPYFA
ncbi:hypothetical protein ScPMuIL_015196 [Solemya velum]